MINDDIILIDYNNKLKDYILYIWKYFNLYHKIN
jgi:hypothetical protein